MQGFQGNLSGVRSGFSRDLTDADLSTHLQSVTAKGGINVNFFYKKVRIKSRNAETNGTIQTRLCISKQPKGDRSTVAVRFITEEQAQRDWPREFSLFKQYEEVPTTGTPLDELPGISMSQIGLLVLNGLRSIEDLIEVSEDQIAQLGLDAIKAQKTAKAWDEKRKGSAEEISAADIEARFQMQVDAMNKQLEAITARNKELEAQLKFQASVAGGNAAAQNVTEPVAVDTGEELEYDVENMPDPWSEGPATTDGADDLGAKDPDPLMDA
jgi:hypothetical protein